MNKTDSLEDITVHFKLPIFYISSKNTIHENIICDLELVKSNSDTEEPIYKHIFSPTTPLGNHMLSSLTEYYTDNVFFLKETQQMLVQYYKNKRIQSEPNISKHHYQNILTAWNDIKNETGFCEKYSYVDWNFGKFLNHSSLFLQAMSLYNITSPILSLCLPIFILIVPFFIIKAKGQHITLNEYLSILKLISTNHAIGKIFTNFNDVDSSQKIYIIVSVSFYIFSIYQNILGCIRFYSNSKKIHDYLHLFKNYIHETVEKMDSYLTITTHLKTYEEFNNELMKNRSTLENYKKELDKISPFKISVSKIMNMGHILKCFYELYYNKEYNNSLLYSFGFNGYIDNISGLTTNISNKKMNKAKFVKNKTSFKNAFYPNLINKSSVKNSYNLKQNIIITGPNASGKTTLLKTTLINVILSQQFGFGCYKNATICPFQFIHCYLNIPDTSGRDSLFQAEARRCKEIIDCLHNHPKDRHFCVFDELYSGTNPEEARVSAESFMEYISSSKYKNVACILTTHYIQLCENLSNNPKIENYNMKTIKTDETFRYTYKLTKGISKIKGGIKVLYDLNYPSEILQKAIIN